MLQQLLGKTLITLYMIHLFVLASSFWMIFKPFHNIIAFFHCIVIMLTINMGRVLVFDFMLLLVPAIDGRRWRFMIHEVDSSFFRLYKNYQTDIFPCRDLCISAFGKVKFSSGTERFSNFDFFCVQLNLRFVFKINQCHTFCLKFLLGFLSR